MILQPDLSSFCSSFSWTVSRVGAARAKPKLPIYLVMVLESEFESSAEIRLWFAFFLLLVMLRGTATTLDFYLDALIASLRLLLR